MKYFYLSLMMLIITTSSITLYAKSVNTITFLNNSSKNLYVWPVPTDLPAAMAAMVPAHALPLQFSMSGSFSNMYVLASDHIDYLRGHGVNITDPTAVINAIPQLKAAVHYPVGNLAVSKTWSAFDGPTHSVMYAEEILPY